MSSNIPTIPRLKTLITSLKFLRDPITVIRGNLAEYGHTYRFYIGGIIPATFTADPAFIQHILQKNHRLYKKSPIHFEHLGHFVGKGLLTIDGDHWLRQRRLIQPSFHRSRLANLTHLMNEVIVERKAKFDQETQQGPVNMAEHMMDMAFNIIMRSIFSVSVPEEQVRKMSDQITQIQAFVIQLIRQPYLNWWRKLSGKIKEHEDIAADLERSILALVQQRQASGEQRDDLLQMLLDSRYEDTGEAMNQQQLLDELKIIFVAGHETSANGLAWAWYLLSQHPVAVAKIRTELDAAVGERIPTFEDLPKLEYLSQVVDEVLRMYPPAWITDRMAAEDDEFNGIKIAKGAIVATYIYGAHHSPEHWDEPEVFKPERFVKGAKIPPFAYLPFGGGPRLCIGNHFALMEMQLVIAEMIKRYDFALEPGHEVVPQPLITLRPKDGIWMRFWKR